MHETPAHSTPFPYTTLFRSQKFLAKFVGDWDVVKTFYPRSGGAPSRQREECRQTMIHDGRFLQSDFTFRRGEVQTTGKGRAEEHTSELQSLRHLVCRLMLE